MLQIVVLAVVQGLTEFLPISSAAHLVMVPKLTGWPDQGLDVDIAVHLGTLGAVILYCWRDVFAMAGGLWRTLRGKADPGARLLWQVVAASVPVVIAGLALKSVLPESFLRSVLIIGWATLIWGLALWVVDKLCLTVKRMTHMGYADALIIGLFQVLALVPGTSRSGITMMAARLLGYERPDAARFSLLLSIPTILGAGTLAGVDLFQARQVQMTESALIAMGLSFIVALATMAVMMAWLRRASFTPFVLYRVAVGLALLAWGYGWVSL